MTNINYIMTSKSLTVFLDGKPHTIDATNKEFDSAKKALQTHDVDALRTAINRSKIVEQFSTGSDISVKDGNVLYQGKIVRNGIAKRIVQMAVEGFDNKPMIKFLENVMKNPSNRSINELYGFLEANSLPITEDGCFLAYKRINSNFRDCHTDSMDNSVGKTVSMERNHVDDRCEQTCSHGLHVCSFDYLKHFGGAKTVLVKVNPMHVVSVPNDYNNAKMRVCEYVVLEDITDKVKDESGTVGPMEESPVFYEKFSDEYYEERERMQYDAADYSDDDDVVSVDMSDFIEWAPAPVVGDVTQKGVKTIPQELDEREEVEVKFRGGTRRTGEAWTFAWWHDGDLDDIVAYRILD